MRRFISAPGLTVFFTYTLFISSTFTIAGQDASIVFLYLLGIYSLIRQRKWPDMSHPLLWMFLLFTAISLVSGIFNQYEVDTLMNLRNNWRFVFPFVLLTAMYQVDEKNLLKTYYGFWLFIALYGIVQFFTGVDWFRPEESSLSTPYMGTGDGFGIFHAKGNFTHHLTFGGSMLLCSSLAASFVFLKGLDWKIRSLMFFAVGLLWMSALASLGRSIWIGLMVSLMILLVRISPKLMLALTLLVGISAIYLFVGFESGNLKTAKPETRLEMVQHRLASGFSMKSNQDRLLMWKSAWQGIQDHFWLGIGFEQDAEVMEAYRKKVSNETGFIRYFFTVGLHDFGILFKTNPKPEMILNPLPCAFPHQ